MFCGHDTILMDNLCFKIFSFNCTIKLKRKSPQKEKNVTKIVFIKLCFIKRLLFPIRLNVKVTTLNELLCR